MLWPSRISGPAGSASRARAMKASRSAVAFAIRSITARFPSERP